MTPSMTTPAAPPLSTEPVDLSQPTRRAGGEVTAGRLVSRTISVWWRNIFKFIAVAVVTLPPALVVGGGVPYALFRRTTEHGAARPELAKLGLVLVLLLVPLMVAALTIQMAALTYGAVQHLAGRPVRFGAMLAAGLRRALPATAAAIIVGVSALFGLILLIIPGIIFSCAFGLAIPAVVIEKMGPIAALQRSWDLTNGYRFRFFAAYLALGLAGFGVNLVDQFAIVFAGRAAPLVVLVSMLVYLLLV